MEGLLPRSKELDMIDYDDADTVLGPSTQLLELLQEDSDDDEPFYTSTDIQNQMKEEHSDPIIVKRELSEEPVQIKEETRTITMKSSRREDDYNGNDRYSPRTVPRESPIRSIRRKYANSTTTPHSPVSAPLQFSPNARSSPVGLSTPNFLSTPTDLVSTSSSSSEGIYYGSKETLVNDAGSLERNVSSLNIAKDSIKKEMPVPTRENHLLLSPTRPAPQPKRADVFIPPAAVFRNGNQQENVPHGNVSQGNEQMKPERIGQPMEGDRITVCKYEYEIVREIGKGASGVVYQALCLKPKFIVALKWVELRRQEDRQNVLEEIALMNSLKGYDNVVKIMDYKETTHAIYIIMEYGETDFNTLLKNQSNKPWDINFIRYYWNQMIHCVSVIHNRDIVHSDLKPANFVVVRGFLKLIDFGIAKRVSDDTTNIQRDSQVGTVNYMSPEALTDLNGGHGVDFLIKQSRASDVWSLGCILYQMVYGNTPFHDVQPMYKKQMSITNPDCEIKFDEVIRKSSEEIKVPEVLRKLLKLCLNRNPTIRPPLSELIRHPFVNA